MGLLQMGLLLLMLMKLLWNCFAYAASLGLLRSQNRPFLLRFPGVRRGARAFVFESSQHAFPLGHFQPTEAGLKRQWRCIWKADMVQGSLMISHLDSQDFQCLGSMDRSSREIQDKWLNKISTAVHDTRSARIYCSSTVRDRCVGKTLARRVAQHGRRSRRHRPGWVEGMDTVGNARDDYCEILWDRNAKNAKETSTVVCYFFALEAKTNTTLHPCILCLTDSVRVSAKISFDFDSGPQEIYWSPWR